MIVQFQKLRAITYVARKIVILILDNSNSKIVIRQFDENSKYPSFTSFADEINYEFFAS